MKGVQGENSLRIRKREQLINDKRTKEMRPTKIRGIKFGSEFTTLKILVTIESGGTITYLAATEDTRIKAKITDEIIIEKCFIKSSLNYKYLMEMQQILCRNCKIDVSD